MRTANQMARNIAIGGNHRHVVAIAGELRCKEGPMPTMWRNFGLYAVQLKEVGPGVYAGVITVNTPGNGRAVDVIKNPSSGAYELWGRGEGVRDRENRLEYMPAFNTADRYETVSTLEEPTSEAVEVIAADDRALAEYNRGHREFLREQREAAWEAKRAKREAERAAQAEERRLSLQAEAALEASYIAYLSGGQ